MIAVETRTYTAAEYLAQERPAFEKSEYFDGHIYPMAGATKEHNRIKENLSGEIYLALKGQSCQSFSSDFRVHIPKNGLYAYPDLIVVCGEIQLLDDGKLDTLLNPTVLIEVLSKSTGGYDETDKFALYRDIPTLREYITVDSRRIKAEVWYKTAKGVWSLAKETDQLTDSIESQTINVVLPLRTIYDRVTTLVPHA